MPKNRSYENVEWKWPSKWSTCMVLCITKIYNNSTVHELFLFLDRLLKGRQYMPEPPSYNYLITGLVFQISIRNGFGQNCIGNSSLRRTCQFVNSVTNKTCDANQLFTWKCIFSTKHNINTKKYILRNVQASLYISFDHYLFQTKLLINLNLQSNINQQVDYENGR